MERWELDQLDKLSNGDVALKVFNAQAELSDLETQRANAARAVADARTVLEAAELEYREACSEERHYSLRLAALKKYLNSRLDKENN